jgi:hypothetical protein
VVRGKNDGEVFKVDDQRDRRILQLQTLRILQLVTIATCEETLRISDEIEYMKGERIMNNVTDL